MDITKLRSGAHNKEDIVLAGVLHDKRCLEAADEIERLRRALVIYGDRARMSTVADMAMQQAIDRAFESAR